MTEQGYKKGFAIVTVLFVMLIGALLGAGALLLFRFQCQLRIDRQHELEKICAVRSALNYIATETISDSGSFLGYHTGSGRDLSLVVDPVEIHFPRTENVEKRDFVMEWGDLHIPSNADVVKGGYNAYFDYAYGAEGVTNLPMTICNADGYSTGIVFRCEAATSTVVRCWCNVGMRGVGGWLQEDYGMRYVFYPRRYAVNDIIRVWLIRDIDDPVSNPDGRSLGWSLSGSQKAIVLEIRKSTQGDQSIMTLNEQEGDTVRRCLCRLAVRGDENYMGIQLAHDNASLFYVGNEYDENMVDKVVYRGFVFSEVATLSSDFYDYFQVNPAATDDSGKIIKAHDLRIVFDCELVKSDLSRILTDLSVTPGFQYNVSIANAEVGTTNRATVAQRLSTFSDSGGNKYTVLTYDTHGTDHRGFRKDERDAVRRELGGNRAVKWTRERVAGFGGTSNDEIAARIAAARRRRIWKIVLISNAVALIAAIAGCLMMLKSQGIRAGVAEMRDEVGETLTMMALGGANEAVAKHIPRLIDTVDRWERKFAAKSENFRGMDVEINQVQEMSRLGKTAERWRKELEGVSPTQRSVFWQKGLKALVEAEQKKWPNRTHQKGASEWMTDLWKEFWFGFQHGALWPVGLYKRTAELIKGGRAIDMLGPGDCLRYILFPYRISSFTMLRLGGIVVVTSAIGYLLCWIGLKTRFGALSYVGLIYFLYLLMIVLFILGLEIME